MPRKSKTSSELVEWLLLKAVKQDNCLVSHLRPNAKGYVPVQVGGRNGIKWRAHRLVYVVKIRGVSPDLMVLHSCDNRACINPDHLFVGTAKDNTQDMMQKGRNKYILPNNQKVDPQRIYALHDLGHDRFDIAATLNISATTVWNYISQRGPYYGK